MAGRRTSWLFIDYLVASIRVLGERRGERGATAVEYALMVGLIAVVIVVSVTALGGAVNGLFQAAVSAFP